MSMSASYTVWRGLPARYAVRARSQASASTSAYRSGSRSDRCTTGIRSATARAASAGVAWASASAIRGQSSGRASAAIPERIGVFRPLICVSPRSALRIASETSRLYR